MRVYVVHSLRNTGLEEEIIFLSFQLELRSPFLHVSLKLTLALPVLYLLFSGSLSIKTFHKIAMFHI